MVTGWTVVGGPNLPMASSPAGLFGFFFSSALVLFSEEATGEGHSHLYVDGEKRARIYGQWLHVPDLGSGSHDVKVTLNANDHGVLTVNGQPIAASGTLEKE